MNMRAQQFLLDLAELIEQHGGADFYYTTSDDGIHIKLDGDREDCFVGFDLLPNRRRPGIGSRPLPAVHASLPTPCSIAVLMDAALLCVCWFTGNFYP